MLLDITGEVTPDHSQQHTAYRFTLDRPAAKLWFSFTYTPKMLTDSELAKPLIMEGIDLYMTPEQKELLRDGWERYMPLNNLITVSVDDPIGYRGACHRHDPEQLLYISEREASPGLSKGLPVTGLWSVTLSFHAIVTEQCSYKLAVWTSEEDTGCAG